MLPGTLKGPSTRRRRSVGIRLDWRRHPRARSVEAGRSRLACAEQSLRLIGEVGASLRPAPTPTSGSRGSGGPLVLVDDPTEDLATPDLAGARLVLSR